MSTIENATAQKIISDLETRQMIPTTRDREDVIVALAAQIAGYFFSGDLPLQMPVTIQPGVSMVVSWGNDWVVNRLAEWIEEEYVHTLTPEAKGVIAASLPVEPDTKG